MTMALIKNEIPILEYDTDENAVLMAKNIYDSAGQKKAISLFQQQHWDRREPRIIICHQQER